MLRMRYFLFKCRFRVYLISCLFFLCFLNQYPLRRASILLFIRLFFYNLSSVCHLLFPPCFVYVSVVVFCCFFLLFLTLPSSIICVCLIRSCTCRRLGLSREAAGVPPTHADFGGTPKDRCSLRLARGSEQDSRCLQCRV